MRVRVAATFLALVAALLVAACGGGGGAGKSSTSSGGGSVPAGADYVPSSAPGFFFVDTDSGSSQWKNASDLLDKFPGKDQLIAMLEQSLAKQKVSYEQDVKPAIGPEADVGVLGLTGKTQALVVLKPKDESKLEALIKKGETKTKTLFKRIGDWTALSDKLTAVDAAAAAHSGSSLKDNANFTDAMKDLPGDALAKLYFDGASLSGLAKSRAGGTGTTTIPGLGQLVSIAAAAEARQGGVQLDAVVRTSKATTLAKNYSSKLVSEVPAGVLAYVSFAGLDKGIDALAGLPQVKAQLGKIEAQLGVSLADLAPLFAGEGALYVRQGIPLPEVTLVLQESDTATAQATADKLLTKLAPALHGTVTSTTVDGVAVKQIRGQQFSLYYGTFDGKLVLTDSTTGISGLKDSGEKLSDDALFKAARSSAGMPDSTSGFVYVNLKDTIPLLENLVTSSGRNLPPAVQQNLEPLRSLLFYSTIDGPKAKVSGFLGIE